MMWLILLVVAVVLFLFLRRKGTNGGEDVPTPNYAEHPALPEQSGGVTVTRTFPGEEDEELFAVLAAAIAEFEGTSEFQILRIRPSSHNWALTGRQDLMRSRM